MTELYWKIILLEGDYERLILLFHSGMYFKNIMEIFKQKSREIFHSKHLYTDHLHSTINILLYMPYISIHFDSSIHPSVFFFFGCISKWIVHISTFSQTLHRAYEIFCLISLLIFHLYTVSHTFHRKGKKTMRITEVSKMV